MNRSTKALLLLLFLLYSNMAISTETYPSDPSSPDIVESDTTRNGLKNDILKMAEVINKTMMNGVDPNKAAGSLDGFMKTVVQMGDNLKGSENAIREGGNISDELWGRVYEESLIDPITKPIFDAKTGAKIVTPLTGKSIAFIVGNGAYPGLMDLGPTPRNDARVVRNKLSQCGFSTLTMFDYSRKDLLSAIKTIPEKSVGYDVVLFYYSGHGVYINGRYYIIPIDIESGMQNEPEALIDISAIFRMMNNIGAEVNIAVIDACGESVTVGGGLTVDASRYNINSSIVMHAVSEGEAAVQSTGSKLSPFTENFVRRIDQCEEIEQFSKNLRTEMAMRKNPLLPKISGSLIGNIDFYFKPPSHINP